MKKRAAGLVLMLAALSAVSTEPGKNLAQFNKEFPDRDSPEASIYRGSIVFENYCILCHGVKADGNGRAARIYNPKPANLLTSDKNDDYKELIIRRGGAAMARSEFMPPWGEELTEEQITDVVAFLRSIQLKKPQ